MADCQNCHPDLARSEFGIKPLGALSAHIVARSAICADCEHRSTSTIPIIQVKIERCGLCGCPQITRQLTSCPKGKW